MLGVIVLTREEHLIPGHQHLVKMAYRRALSILSTKVRVCLTRPTGRLLDMVFAAFPDLEEKAPIAVT